MEIRHQQLQQQEQRLSPQMLQSLRLLQLPVQDLQKAVAQEVQNNPFLEHAPENRHSSLRTHPETDPFSPQVENNTPIFPDNGFGENYLTGGNLENSSDEISILNNIPANVSPRDYLLDQAIGVKTEIQDVLENLIDHLDERGFLPPEVLAELGFQPTSKGFYSSDPIQQEAYELLRSMQPLGIGAVDLRDCLLLQLSLNTPLYNLIKQHFEDVIHHRFAKLQRSLHCSPQELRRLLAPLRELNFAPLSSLNGSPTVDRHPEIFFKKDGSQWIATLSGIPHLQFNDTYRELIQKKLSQKEKVFFTTYKNRSRLLMRALEQRQQTLQKIADYLLKYQEDFFHHGTMALHPQSIKQVAEMLQLSPSTLTRAAQRKYIQIEREIYPLSIFFTHGNSNSLFSTQALKEKLQELVKNETNPLSDEQLAQRLTEEGFPIARRTVTKYRNRFNIPPANIRRIFHYEGKK